MGINSLVEDAVGIAKENTVLTALGAGAAATGVIVGGAAIVRRSRRRKVKRRKAKSRRKRTGRALDRRYISREKHEIAYQRRRKRLGKRTYGKKYKTRTSRSNGRRVFYARKTGQPYIILSSGKARFIKGKRRK